MEVLIITGQAGYHSWQLNYKALQDAYASHELFSHTVLISPAKGDDMGGSGKHEPVMFTIQYHKGRVFHTVLGHMSEGSETAMYGKGFRTFLLRGTEWAASNKVTQVPVTEF